MPSRLSFCNDSLGEDILHYANWGLAWSSNRTYTLGEKSFLQFYLMNRLISPNGDIIFSPEKLPLFILRRTCIWPGQLNYTCAIKRYLAAVHSLHILCGHENPLLGKLFLKKSTLGYFTLSGPDPYLSHTSYPGEFTGYTA